MTASARRCGDRSRTTRPVLSSKTASLTPPTSAATAGRPRGLCLGGAQGKLNLSQSKEQQVTQELSREAAQSAPGYQGEVGSKPPASLAQKSLPNDVTDQVPETKSYLFIKLPDRILLIDPDTKEVAEIVGGPMTTGSPSGPANAGMPQR
jgi:hypothetical protein